MSAFEWTWTLIVAACLLWYATVTFFVAFRGTADIRNMLARLNIEQSNEGGSNPKPG